MQQSLAILLDKAIVSWKDTNPNTLRKLTEQYPTQILLVGFVTLWTFQIEDHIKNKKDL